MPLEPGVIAHLRHGKPLWAEYLTKQPKQNRKQQNQPASTPTAPPRDRRNPSSLFFFLMVTDNNIEPFHWQDWDPIEHFAAQGVIKDSIWTARMTRLGLKARIDIPVAGTMINVVNDRLQVENPPNGWPITAESEPPAQRRPGYPPPSHEHQPHGTSSASSGLNPPPPPPPPAPRRSNPTTGEWLGLNNQQVERRSNNLRTALMSQMSNSSPVPTQTSVEEVSTVTKAQTQPATTFLQPMTISGSQGSQAVPLMAVSAPTVLPSITPPPPAKPMVAASQIVESRPAAPSFFFLRLPNGQYGPVSQLSRSEESCTGPFNWGEAHCAGEKVKRKIGPFQWKSL